METPALLLDFALVLIAAVIGGTAFRYLKMPRVVGMLVAGIALGPFTPGFVVKSEDIKDLALLGAVFLMFSSGLSFDIRTFGVLGTKPFVLAGLGVGLSFVLGFALGLLVNWSMLSSIFLGLILTSTSTVLGLKLMVDLGLTDESGYELVTAAILVDDVVALSLMTIAVGLAGPESVPPLVLIAGLVAIVGLAVLLIVVSRLTFPRILRFTDKHSPSSTVMVSVSFCLLISFGFAMLGLPPFVGAFFAGSIVASTQQSSRVTSNMAPVTAIFMAVFFTSVGLLINPAQLVTVALIGVALVAIAVFAKMLPGMLVLRNEKGMSSRARLILATVLVPRAEISLIIAQFGVTLGAPPELLALAMIVMIVTALLPGAVAWFAKWPKVQKPASQESLS
ncbi:MAG: cation:proton antiporter [Thermoplasmatota archaeon]|nr:cation:proton antiporter [Candidatus Thermoplasmatota archaeon]MBU1914078.1 cation:proton antiporter [Candidatus Thermoplasmatota archaeon]